MRFSQVVEPMDVAEAIRLVRSAMQQAALDPRTGTIDMDLITTGRSANSRFPALLVLLTSPNRARINELAKELKNAMAAKDAPNFRLDQLLRMMTEQSSVPITIAEMRDAVKQLEDEEFLTISGDPRNPIIMKRVTA